jgi:folate-dependent phosphoribosylglycinamide formyltransferase PurN
MYGRRVHEAVVKSGARISGATVHFVDEIYDHGAIIAQWPVPVLAEDDAEALASRVLAVEHRLLPAVVEAYAQGRYALGPAGRVEWTGSWYPGDEFTMVSNQTTD